MSGDDSGNRVFVGNIHFSVTERDLEEKFSRVGRVMNSKVLSPRVWLSALSNRAVIFNFASSSPLLLFL